MIERHIKNQEILHILDKYLNDHPELRFIQALWALGIVDREDRFYEEPEETLRRINTMTQDIKLNIFNPISTKIGTEEDVEKLEGVTPIKYLGPVEDWMGTQGNVKIKEDKE